jgi:hypothetical protein
MLQVGRLRVRFSMSSLDFSVDLILSSRTMALGSTQPLTEMNTRDFPGRIKGGRRDFLEKKWKTRSLTNVWASTVCYKDSFTFITLPEIILNFFFSGQIML